MNAPSEGGGRCGGRRVEAPGAVDEADGRYGFGAGHGGRGLASAAEDLRVLDRRQRQGRTHHRPWSDAGIVLDTLHLITLHYISYYCITTLYNYVFTTEVLRKQIVYIC